MYGDMYIAGGDVCECYDDDVNGHWINPQDGCVVCLEGWNLPHCTECAARMYTHIPPLAGLHLISYSTMYKF